MSYIAFDLDALNAAPNVARAARVSEDAIIGGLLRLWAHAFRTRADMLDELEVRGCFDTPADVVPALKAYGFLADADGKRLRVRGADRYLRVTEQRQKAGEARARSAGRSAGRFTSETPADRQRPPAADQRTTSESPALTPSTEHRAPNTIKEGSSASASTPPLQLEALPAKAVRTRKPPDPAAEFARFLAACTEDERRVFRAYGKAFDLPDALAPDWGLLKFVRGKLQAHHVEELEAAVAGAGREKWHREKGTSLRALLSDSSKVAQLAKRGAA